MNYKITFIFLIITSTIFSQNNTHNFEIISKGYYIQKLHKEPILWVVCNNTDSLKLFTNNPKITDSFEKIENIESIDILKDEQAKATYGEFGKNGVVFIHYKTKQWNTLDSLKNTLKYNQIFVDVLKTKDTIYLNSSPSTKKFTKPLLLNKDALKIRKNGVVHTDNSVELLLHSNTKFTSTTAIINSQKATKIILPMVSLSTHTEGIYTLIFDIDLRKIIWQGNFTKYLESDAFEHRITTDSEGFQTIETIEIDALNGDLIQRKINDKVQVIIR